jgi:hypothetical protein
MTTTKTTGSKYEETRNLNIAQIAKLVRADLKADSKAGRLPKGVKYSVRISNYSMGCSLTVTVKAVPEGFEIVNPLRAQLDRDEPHFAYHTLTATDPRLPRLTDQAVKLVADLTELVNVYNRKDIDIMTDYYNVAFNESIGFDPDLERADRERALAECPDGLALALGNDERPTAPSCQVVSLGDARANGAQAALKAADAEQVPAVTAEPTTAQAPAQANQEAASEYTSDQLDADARAIAAAAGLELVTWSIRIRNNGRLTLVVKGTKTETVGGYEIETESTLTCAL